MSGIVWPPKPHREAVREPRSVIVSALLNVRRQKDELIDHKRKNRDRR
jgi:hypothetical protein